MEKNHCNTPGANHCGSTANSCNSGNKCGGGKKWGKCLLAIILFAAFSMVVGGVVWGKLFFEDWTNESVKAIFRSKSDPMWQYGPYMHLLQAIVFVTMFKRLGQNICSPCGTKFGKGAIFGLYFFFIQSLGCGWWFLSENITIDVVYAALVNNIITDIIGGGIVGILKAECSKPSSCEAK